MILTREQLRGLPREKAELYGKPHIGAHYENAGSARKYERDAESCAICGKQAVSCHHMVPLSRGEIFQVGRIRLRSPLMALCGSGSSGCHGGFQDGRYRIAWLWYDEEAEQRWWLGELLEEFGPHSPMLYLFGRYEIYDRNRNRVFFYVERV